MSLLREVRFYQVGEHPYGVFSNFSAYPFVLKGLTWPTSEHYFQAQKFAGTDHEETLRQMDSPMKVAKAGRERTRPLRPDWEAVKDEVMLDALRAKFHQHPSLTSLLLGTGDAEIFEDARGDAYWGTGPDGQGKNMLGKLLVRLREELRAKMA